jgi:hypothetical protein
MYEQTKDNKQNIETKDDTQWRDYNRNKLRKRENEK